MYDFIKLTTWTKDIEYFKKLTGLEYIATVSDETGEIKLYEGVDNGLKFKIFPNGRIIFQGSLHKYFNGGNHNYNDFSINDFNDTIDKLILKYNCDLRNFYIKNLEIGVNLKLDYDPNLIISNLISHKGVEFDIRCIRAGKYGQAKHSQFIIKAYNKGKQYGTYNKLFRFEIKYMRMQHLKNNNIGKLADLIVLDNIYFLQKEIIKKWDEIFLLEPSLNVENKPISMEFVLEKYSNPNYWKSLYIDSKKAKNKRYYKELKLYKKMVNNYVEISKKEQIKSLIINKLKKLNIDETDFQYN